MFLFLIFFSLFLTLTQAAGGLTLVDSALVTYPTAGSVINSMSCGGTTTLPFKAQFFMWSTTISPSYSTPSNAFITCSNNVVTGEILRTMVVRHLHLAHFKYQILLSRFMQLKPRATHGIGGAPYQVHYH